MVALIDVLALTALPSALALGVGAVLLWVVSLVRKDASVADPAWAPAFLLVALASLAAGPPPGDRAYLVLFCVAAWASRLGSHLLRRNRAHGEDARYVAMRATHGSRFWWVSLFTVFLLQASLAWLVSLPVQAAMVSTAAFGPLDLLGFGLFGVGLCVEALADVQLNRFRADPRSRGRVLDTGLWRYSRHPNYFGNAVLWWGLGVVSLGTGAWPALVGPLLMNTLLLKVSGVVLLEKDIAERRPAYARYIQETSPFIPRPPRSRSG